MFRLGHAIQRVVILTRRYPFYHLGCGVAVAVAQEILDCWRPVSGYVTPTPPRKLWHAVALLEAMEAGVPVEGILSTSRKKIYTKPRQNGFRKLRALGYGYSAIGRRVGRDHSTILYAVRGI